MEQTTRESVKDSPRGVPLWERWGAFSWILVIIVGAVALAIGLGLLDLIELMARPLALLILGITLALALSPAADWLERWIPRLAAVVLLYVVIGLILVGLGWLVLPSVWDSVQQAREQLPASLRQVQQRLSQQFGPWIPDFTQIDLRQLIGAQAGGNGQSSGASSSSLLSVPVRIGSIFFNIILVIFVSIYWLLAMPAMSRFILSLFPEERHKWIAGVMNNVSRDMGGYVRGAFLNGVIMVILYYVGLSIIGVNYALVLALVGGTLEAIPVIGTIISTVLVVGVALLQSPSVALITLVYMVFLQILEGNVLVPNVMRHQADVSPLLSLFAIFAGGAIGGILGALVAIPIAAALHIITREIAAPIVRRWSGAAPEP